MHFEQFWLFDRRRRRPS